MIRLQAVSIALKLDLGDLGIMFWSHCIFPVKRCIVYVMDLERV